MTYVWERAVAVLESEGRRSYLGVPGDSPGLLDFALDAGAAAFGFRDQRAAAFAAAGATRTLKTAAVLCTHSGPDLLNALVGISEAYSARIPLVVVTSIGPPKEIGRGAFQHFPVETLSTGLFRWTHQVTDEVDLYWALSRATHIANSLGGPAHVIVPAEIGAAEACLMPDAPRRESIPAAPAPGSVRAAAGILLRAQRPMLLLGGGCSAADPAHAVAIANSVDAACVVTASGRGAFSESHPRFGGLAGLYLAPEAAAALDNADAILVVGSQLEETARMGWEPDASCHVIQVDTDPVIAGRVLHADAVIADADTFLSALRGELTEQPDKRSRWWPGLSRHHRSERRVITAPSFWETLSDALPRSTTEVLAQENGLADLWGYYTPTFALPDGVVSLAPGEQTALGFGIGSGLGAALCGRRVVAVGGDGAFSMNMSIVLTAIERDADITFIVLRDGGFGWPSLSRPEGAKLVEFGLDVGAEALTRAAAIPTFVADDHITLSKHLSTVLDHQGPALLTVSLAERIPFPPERQSPETGQCVVL